MSKNQKKKKNSCQRDESNVICFTGNGGQKKSRWTNEWAI